MTITRPDTLRDELDALGPQGRRRAAARARDMLAAEIGGTRPELVDPIPVVVTDAQWQDLAAGLAQRARLLDELLRDFYGARTVLTGEVAPAEAIFADPAYLRPAVGMPGGHLLMLSCVVERTADGTWQVLEDRADVPDGSGLAIELRRVLSRSAPSLYRSTPLHRLHPFYDAMRTSLHARLRAEGRAGRLVVLAQDTGDLPDFDHRLLAQLLGAPSVSATDLVIRDGTVRLHAPAGTALESTGVDAILRLVPSAQVDPLDLGPTPLGGVTGLVETARRGEVAVLNPIGAGILENAALRAALPDLCRQVLHEDLRLHSPAEDAADGPAQRATAASLDPDGSGDLVERPVTVQLMVVAGENGFEVLPGGIARTDDAGPRALKDVWVLTPEPSPAPEGQLAPAAPPVRAGLLPPRPEVTPSIGTDLFWFGRYLERVDTSSRVLRTVLDIGNDLAAERSADALVARGVLLRAVTDVTTTFPGFHEVDLGPQKAVDREIIAVIADDSRPGSLGQSFRALEQSTLSLRELMGDDIWPALTRMRATVRALGSRERPPLEQSLSVLLDGCLTLTGAVTETMSRGLGRDLWEAGRRIERAAGLIELLASVLAVRRSPRVEQRLASALAAITGATGALRRTYQSPPHPELLAGLLLESTALPRSLAFQIERLRETIDRLPDMSATSEVRSLLSDLRTTTEALDARVLLQVVEPDGDRAPGGAVLRTRAPQELAAPRQLLRSLSTALEEEFFRAPERTAPWGIDLV